MPDYTCKKCHIQKPDTEFYGPNRVCTTCYKVRVAQYQSTHLEQHRLSSLSYNRRNPSKILKNSARYRARRMTGEEHAILEEIDPLEIAERDLWRCHICHKKVTPNDMVLDHLIPVSLGGNHTKANVALAHHLCNNTRQQGKNHVTPLRLL